MNYTTEDAAFSVEVLLRYAAENGLTDQADINFVRNALLDLLALDKPYTGPKDPSMTPLPEFPTPLLEPLLDYLAESGLLPDNTLTQRDLTDTRIMGELLQKPSAILNRFAVLQETAGIEEATASFYRLCQKSDYIRMERIARNMQWTSESPYGPLQITINLTKPEKDPREIAAQKHAPQSGYPKCLLCPENVGYAGSVNHPARQTLRTLPLTLQGEPWHFQYSPYVYYNEHCIVLKEAHVPMKLERKTFERLLDFVDAYPHYFIGSNADLPIVGGSILNHDHFQGGRYVFPMETASLEYDLHNARYDQIRAGVVHWPMSVLRLQSLSREALADAAENVLINWCSYSDPAAEILAFSNTAEGKPVPHNTLTPIARRKADCTYELDLVLRNNRTDDRHPLGIFHPHQDLHHIKKENIGLIEVMGLFILPGRLLQELKALAELLTGETAYDSAALAACDHPLSHHAHWMQGLAAHLGTELDKETARQVLRQAVGDKCQRVLEDAGVFKTDTTGRAAFDRFLYQTGWTR